MKKIYLSLFLFLFLLSSEVAAQCLQTISLNTIEAGTWVSDCPSQGVTDSYAKYYTFTVTGSKSVTIDLKSNVDTFLILRSGAGQTGTIIASNDDVDPPSDEDSRIIRTLTAGSYTIEATTFSSATTGSFAVSLFTTTSGDCIDQIAFNINKSGTWVSTCASANQAGRYAHFYTFTLTGTAKVTIDLTSTRDSYLYLLSGAGKTGSVIEEDDDDGDGFDARIIRTLPAGSYTVEATTVNITTGNFVISVDTTASGDCIDPIAFNSNKAGTWVSTCASDNRVGRYAHFYTFTLTGTAEVTIDLASLTDSYLYLLSGTGKTGSVIESDDDGGNSNNARIIRTLPAGNYTVEATTEAIGATGNFVVSVDTTIISDDCIDPIAFSSNKSGTWVSSCASANRVGSYAHFYTFTLTGIQEVTIDLTSSKDTYLFLLNGSGTTGSVRASNDDRSGGSEDSRIIITLPAGTYTIEATTFDPATTGNFVVKVSVGAPVCTDCQFMINAGLNDAWLNTATNGQGMTITVFPVLKEIFVAWFTFDTERPPEDVTAILGEPGHRWLTAQGSYDEDTAVLTIYLTEGGVFDSALPATTTDQDGYGTMTIEFSGCNEGLVTYEITSLDISGIIPIERIVLDNVPLCELLNEQEQ